MILIIGILRCERYNYKKHTFNDIYLSLLFNTNKLKQN